MADQATYLTAEGKQKLEEELEELKNVKRPEIAARLRHAIEQGDISENADYSSAKEDQGFMEGRIQELEKLLSNVKLIDEMDAAATELEGTVAKLKTIDEIKAQSEYVRDAMIPAMDKLRSAADKAETMTAEDYYPFPTYDKLLFGV